VRHRHQILSQSFVYNRTSSEPIEDGPIKRDIPDEREKVFVSNIDHEVLT